MQSNLTGHTEPEIVYNLFFAARAVSDWQAFFSSLRPTVSYGGVFTHQKPYVTFAGKTCELADLLIVFSDRRKQERTAVLYQAKMGRRWKQANKTQWELLTTWPTIAYNPGPKAVSRTMPFAGLSNPAANYMLIQRAPPQVETAAAEPAFSACSLPNELLSVLERKSGRPFSWDRPSAQDDWDQLIWDLLDHTANAVTPVASVKQPRGAGVLSLLTNEVFSPPENGDSEGDQPEEEWGIPVIQLSSEGSDENSRD
jgi:hypothetical protein